MSKENLNIIGFIKSSKFVYLIIGLGIAISYIIPFAFPITRSEYVIDAYNFIEDMPPESKVILSVEFGPSAWPEVGGGLIGMGGELLGSILSRPDMRWLEDLLKRYQSGASGGSVNPYWLNTFNSYPLQVRR